MLTAEFTATNRVGDGIVTVTFNDASTGIILSRKWILGDGTVVDGNLTTLTHTYYPGTYDVTLVVEGSSSQNTKTKQGYVVVNEIHPQPNLVIAEGYGAEDSEWWRFRFDAQLRLVYENLDYVYRSASPVVSVGKWALVEFHAGNDEMYVGTYDNVRRKVNSAKYVNTNVPAVNDNVFYVAPNSTIKIDELKIWEGEKDLRNYYYQTRAKAGMLDR